MKRAWRDNSPALFWLGLGLGVGLLTPTLWIPGPLTQVTTGWAILVVSILGLLWIPVGDYVRRRITWLPDPPARPITPRMFITTDDKHPHEEMLGGDTWAVRSKRPWRGPK